MIDDRTPGDLEAVKWHLGVCEAAVQFLTAARDELREAASAVLAECKGGETAFGNTTCGLLQAIDTIDLALSRVDWNLNRLTGADEHVIAEAVGGGTYC
jgi:hypothetical protein